MPYMIYQQYTTAVKQAYTGDDSVEEHYAQAKACRQWLASLKIDAKLRDPMVEPVAAIEEAFKDMLPRA
jgi:hypothetical protein